MSNNNNCLKRLINDLKYIKKNNLELLKNNIFYKHDENNYMMGYAMLIGNSDTPYNYGYYFFKFIFSNNYPYEPPIVKFISNSNVRFHPNLYVNGKICLSILNTWKGEGWTSCQSIYSILIIISSILTQNSLTYEPGITISHYDVEKYNLLIEYKNIEYSILHIIDLINNISDNKNNISDDKNNISDNKNYISYNTNNICNNDNNIIIKFKEEIIDNFIKNKSDINKKIKILSTNIDTSSFINKNTININTYNLKYNLNIDKLFKIFYKIENKYK
jgi:ubiquitin-protein ligase